MRSKGAIVRGALAFAILVGTPSAAGASGSSPVRSFVRRLGRVKATRTLIVVNGGPGIDSQQMFRAFKRLATPGRRVVAYDQRGVGRTPAPNTALPDYSLNAFVADLEALRIRLGAERIDLLGHSFGALIASAYTATYPGRVRSLTLASGLPVACRRSTPAMLDSRSASQTCNDGESCRGKFPSCAPLETTLCCPCISVTLDVLPTVGLRLGPSRCSDVVGTLTNDAIEHDPRRGQLAGMLGRYRGPALVVIGARDPFGSSWVDDDAGHRSVTHA